ncbi:hypothetical protein [Burkholderia gladioli]|uniref:hypothetical protein n=1 Tax=Burkholderia gladioli TaxID=28095 RepID=UPI0016402A88|nr:hypothetical protein [Burkholderia gladioli]
MAFVSRCGVRFTPRTPRSAYIQKTKIEINTVTTKRVNNSTGHFRFKRLREQDGAIRSPVTVHGRLLKQRGRDTTPHPRLVALHRTLLGRIGHLTDGARLIRLVLIARWMSG